MPQRAWPCHRARRHGSTRNYHLRRRYGITSEEFDRLVAEQGHVCAICLTAKPEHVDHDHVTGEVRGLLCFNCTTGLDTFRDRPDVLAAAVDYLGGVAWRKYLVAPGVYPLHSSPPA